MFRLAEITTFKPNKMTNANDPINPINYPVVSEFGQSEMAILPGLTKRELFAAMAMQGLLMNYRDNGLYGDSYSYPMVEEVAVRCADQLIAELNNPQP